MLDFFSLATQRILLETQPGVGIWVVMKQEWGLCDDFCGNQASKMVILTVYNGFRLVNPEGGGFFFL